MKTDISISVFSDFSVPTTEIAYEIEQALGKFKYVVDKYSRFDENSHLSQLNSSGGEWFQTDIETVQLIHKLLRLSETTNGIFDPTLVDILETYGYDKTYDFRNPSDEKISEYVEKRINERSSWREIQVDEEKKMIRLAADQKIDLGSIGKGYAVDLAYEYLESKNIRNFIINAGGDIRISSENISENIIDLIVKHNDESTKIGQVKLEAGYSLASSGTWARRVGNFNHLINSRSGKPIEEISTVFVYGRESWMTDAIATCLAVGANIEDLSEFEFETLIHYKDDSVKISDDFPLLDNIGDPGSPHSPGRDSASPG